MASNVISWYETLPQQEKAVYQVLCCLFQDVTKTILYAFVAKNGFRNTNGKAFSTNDVSALVSRGIAEGLVEKTHDLNAIAPAYRNRLVEDFIKSDANKDNYINIFKEHFSCIKFDSTYIYETIILNTYTLLNLAVLFDKKSEAKILVDLLRLKKGHDYVEDSNRSSLVPFQQLVARAIHFGKLDTIKGEWFDRMMGKLPDYLLACSFDFTALNQALDERTVDEPAMQTYIAAKLLTRCQHVELEALAYKQPSRDIELYLAVSFLISGREAEAMRLFTKNTATQGKTSKKEFLSDSFADVYFIPHMFFNHRDLLPAEVKFPKTSIKFWNNVYRHYACAFKFIGTANALDDYKNEAYKFERVHYVDIMVYCLCQSWMGKVVPSHSIERLHQFYTAGNVDHALLKHEALYLINAANNNKFSNGLQAEASRLEVKVPLFSMMKKEEEWALKLQLIANLAQKNNLAATAVAKEERLVWLVNVKRGEVQPVIQKITKTGWTSGRNAALQRLKNCEFDCITDHDTPVLDCIKQEYSYYNNTWVIDHALALKALVGHPLLFFMDSPSVPLTIEREDVHLVVEEERDECRFSFTHSLQNDLDKLVKHTTNSYKIIVADESITKIALIIGEKLVVPNSARHKVLDVLKNLSGTVKINSALIGEQTGAERVDCFKGLFIHLLPSGNGIKADIYVKPLSPEPPYLKPGEGLAKVVGRVGDKHIWTERDLKKESKTLDGLLEKCPVLSSAVADELSGYLGEAGECLQVLSELREAGDSVIMEWPKGQRFSIKKRLSFDSFSASLKKQNNWFELRGEFAIDEGKVIDLKKMLELLDSTSGGRFVQIEDGVFIELEKHFIKQLEYIKAVSDASAKQVKLHPLAAISSAGLFDSLGSFESDKQWNSFIEKIRKTESTSYKLPRGLDAELRPYQEEGYRWLRKMADWETGACLADDMGLGKTLQCIALLLARVKDGPSLVIAPASVCRNWMSEVEKFTTGIQPVLFGPGDRKEVVNSLEAGALLVVSYGLLNTEAETLSSRTWNVMILDEAHAIKNVQTKRSQVAMSIEAKFKIAATGTPLQNHMGELWNLFQFLNPGLLGSQQSFTERFINPIEKNNSEVARRSLKDLIKPFILRRTKNQVLPELPEKTEITMQVELGDEERAFYEALRVKALNDIQKIDQTANAGEKQLRVLAEIMKLRRACCHSSLASKDINIASSKLQRFEELVDNLVENGHKALVFSQFVDHLSLIRELLDSKGIGYEYLDGSVPGKEREESIRRFQAGSTDLFLISLKAGGVGLNLTAADYVIHMDPWWNPAVEDQASDRAHRIGQTKPVTIYRLVTKDTIEDKIVELHKNKRDLADSLLEGTESAGRVTADEMLGLLRGNL